MSKYFSYFLLLIIAYFIVNPYIEDMLRIEPYYEVKITEESWNRGSLVIRGSFIKNGFCKLETFAVVGTSDGIPRYLNFKDLDDLPKDFDREAGEQGLNISVDISDNTYDQVQIRTRHVCFEGTSKETIQQKVFYTAQNEK